MHFTTSSNGDAGECSVCELAAAFFLPALVGPYFLLRQHRRQEVALNVLDTLGNSTTNGWGKLLVERTSTPIIPDFPGLKATLPEVPKRRENKKKANVVIEPNLPRYEPILLPTSAARFVPRQVKDGIDKVKHPYSYFLSLSPEERKVYLKEKVNRTRSDMGYAPIQPHEDTGAGDWKCGWLSLDEIGVKDSDRNSVHEKFRSLLDDLTKVMEVNKSKLEAIRPDGEATSAAELHDVEADIDAVHRAINSLRKLSADEISRFDLWRRKQAGVTGGEPKCTIDVLNDTVAQLAKDDLQAAEVDKGVHKDEKSQVAEPEVQPDKSKRRERKGNRKRRATSAAIGSAPEQDG